MTDHLLDIDAVMHATTLCKTEIYKRMKAGEFPRSVTLGRKRVAWKASAVAEWIEGLSETGDEGEVD